MNTSTHQTLPIDPKRRSRLAAMTGSASVEPCPKCGKQVSIEVSSGGTRYEKTMYDVICPKCGVLWLDCTPSNCSGRKSDAVKEWNREQRKAKPPNDELTHRALKP